MKITPSPDAALRRPEWQAAAFGVAIDGDFAVPGVMPEVDGRPNGRPPRSVSVRLRSDDWMSEAWRGTQPVRLFAQPLADGSPWVTLDVDPTAGYQLSTADFGRYLVALDGSAVNAAPPDSPIAHWQRMLVGHALPLAALLQGLELFHASAVVLRGGAVAFAGDSHGGKTSLAVQLVLRGADLLSDDALALEPVGRGGVLAHPGGGVVNVRHAEWARLSAQEQTGLGRIIGVDEDAVRVVMPRSEGPAPLRTLVVAERDAGLDEVEITRVEPSAAALLRSTFNFAVRTPARLAVQLATCAAVANAVTPLRVRVPPRVGAAELAAVLDGYLARV